MSGKTGIKGGKKMENMGLGQPFGVAFEEKVMYPDAKYHNLFLVVKADINVSNPERPGDETSMRYVTTIVRLELGEQLNRIGNMGISYKALPEYAPGIASACAEKLQENGFTVNGFNIYSIDIDPEIKDSILKMEQLSQMTPEDLNKKLMEAQQAAMQMAKETGTPIPDSISAGVSTPPTSSAVSYPKFCTNCGMPTTGSKFCTSCGNQLA